MSSDDYRNNEDWYDDEDDNSMDYDEELGMNSFTIETHQEYTFNVEEGIAVYPIVYPGGMVVNVIHNFDNSKNYTGDYTNPPIPKGFKRVEGQWETGIVIESIKTGNQYVWIPVGDILADGTFDCLHECEPFGRRPFEGENLTPGNLKDHVRNITVGAAGEDPTDKEICFTLVEVMMEFLAKFEEIAEKDNETFENTASRTFAILEDIEKMARGERDIEDSSIDELFNILEEFEDQFFEDSFNEDYDLMLRLIHKRVEEDGGFYISRYLISKGEDGMPHSVAGGEPWTNIDFYHVESILPQLEPESNSVAPHLCYGAEIDSMIESVYERNVEKEEDIFFDSSKIGNYRTSRNGREKVLPTGSRASWFLSNIADFCGNVGIMTQEKNQSSYCVVRGGSYLDRGDDAPLPHRGFIPCDFPSPFVGFRVALLINPEEIEDEEVT